VTKRDAGAGRTQPSTSAIEESLGLIKSWEQSHLQRRSLIERVSDAITSFAASGPVLLLHFIVFSGWIVVNSGWIPGVVPFDPIPCPLLTMGVSLEAIFLALFVLASQNRLTRQADMRSQLDLQVNLLAEREMTAVLQLLKDIADHLQVKTELTQDQMDLINKTDVGKLAEEVESEASKDGSPRP
jgi:uncharacterized membrane protein